MPQSRRCKELTAQFHIVPRFTELCLHGIVLGTGTKLACTSFNMYGATISEMTKWLARVFWDLSLRSYLRNLIGTHTAYCLMDAQYTSRLVRSLHAAYFRSRSNALPAYHCNLFPSHSAKNPRSSCHININIGPTVTVIWNSIGAKNAWKKLVWLMTD